MHFSIGSIFRKILGIQKRLTKLEHKLENKLALLESKTKNYGLYACYGQGQPALKYKDTLYQNIESTEIDPRYKYNFAFHRFNESGGYPE